MNHSKTRAVSTPSLKRLPCTWGRLAFEGYRLERSEAQVYGPSRETDPVRVRADLGNAAHGE